MNATSPKELVWIASSLKDLREFPEDVRQVMGFALFTAQSGGKHIAAKPLQGYRGAGVLEVVDDYDGDTCRTVYTARFAEAVYVLHALQKKSKRGVATPKKRSRSSMLGSSSLDRYTRNVRLRGRETRND
ncbi:MAG: type II toxin-antitoxin system RelE/ParE family toxin [Thermoleophilia bacterium]